MKAKCIFLASALLALPAFGAEPSASDWAPSPKSRARLITDGIGGAGFQVELAPNSITYWRDPGDAGVPPTFDFAGSENLARAEALFPAPKRIAESDGGVAFGYDSGVIFPIRIEATDQSKPVRLAVKVDYAVCEKICLPAKAHLALTISKGAASPLAADLAAARARVPEARGIDQLGLDTVAVDEKSWRVCAPSAGAARELFVEPPTGWWITANKEGAGDGRECFTLALREAPANAKFPVAVRMTFATAAGAVETQASLSPKR